MLLLSLFLSSCASVDEGRSQALAALVPAVVAIGDHTNSLASGFYVSQDLIVTNHHVLSQAPLYLIVGSRRFVAELVVGDESMDLAVLSSQRLSNNVLTLADRTANLGERVYVIGNPFGAGITVSQGIVSALPGSVGNIPWLLTDASINTGNSGGPLVDETGIVLGVVTGRGSLGSGIGFAVPVSELTRLVAEAQKRNAGG